MTSQVTAEERRQVPEPIYDKVKAAAVVVAAATALAAIDALVASDFASFGPWGLVIGSGVATGAAYAKKEVAAWRARRGPIVTP